MAVDDVDLTRSYRSLEPLRSIKFSVERGELFGLLWPSGTGKTTTIEVLTTLLLQSAGRARVLGFDVARQANEVRRRIGYVFGGDTGLHDRLSAVRNLRYCADVTGCRRARSRSRDGFRSTTLPERTPAH